MGVYYVEEQTPEPVRPGQLWFGVGAPILIWALHLVIGYALVSLNCVWSLFPFRLFGIEGIRIILLALTILTAVGVLAGGLISFRNWRRLRAGNRGDQIDPTERYRFMMFSGMLLSGLFLLGLLWEIFPIFMVELCPS